MTDFPETFTGEFASTALGSLHLHPPTHPPTETPRSLSDEKWDAAVSLDAFIGAATKHQELWHTTRRLAAISEPIAAAAAALHAPVRLLVLLEDWCGDAIHTIPVVARVAEAMPAAELRVLRRDEHDDLMQRHLTGTARAIPVVIAYDAHHMEGGWWGPRPSPLEAWVLRDGNAMEKEDRYKAIRTWYARDRGNTTAAETIALLQHTERTQTARHGAAIAAVATPSVRRSARRAP